MRACWLDSGTELQTDVELTVAVDLRQTLQYSGKRHTGSIAMKNKGSRNTVNKKKALNANRT